VKEIPFIFYLLRDMGITVKLPIMVRTFNIGAMFMAENVSSGVIIKHMDTGYQVFWVHVEDFLFKIVIVEKYNNDT
jgi:hypothetical protein